jgi:uncharacterized membrane protein YGL010W
MKTLTDHLGQYAAYHRDRRNIATHFVGIPMIVLAVVVLLARPDFDVAGWPISAATVAVIVATLYYLRLDRRLGAVMGALLLGCLWLANATAALSTGAWAAVGVGLFVVGWIIQFVGHRFEGRKPAFVDDISGLIIGPLFVVTEAGFLLGLRPELEAQIEQRAGPTRPGPAGPAQAR